MRGLSHVRVCFVEISQYSLSFALKAGFCAQTKTLSFEAPCETPPVTGFASFLQAVHDRKLIMRQQKA